MTRTISFCLIILVVLVPACASYAQDIHESVKAGRVDEVRQLIDADTSLISAVDDTGNTPLHSACGAGQLDIATLLIDAGADVRAFEPFKTDGLPGIPMAASLEEAIKDADAILLLVRHLQFQKMVPSKIAALTSARVVVDTVNAWDAATWQEAGFQVYRLGVGRFST